ncbi:YbaB/EbfC family nucleoid-associated protein [Actinosynnema pretiosum]|uniref:YbaB/EbfC family nucleoid-associated protein n=1 Tax=Actinosynnema pretiosum TaxID=42197 RepID=UPI001E5C208C|nr:YbaB/EbfC family nucleoid-associated protein [Actinosynnema pretiosum]
MSGDPTRLSAGLVGGAEDAEARIAAWAREAQAKAERYRQVGETAQELRLTATSRDGAVRVTVRPDGVVTDLVLGERSRALPPDGLSALVLDTMRRAQAGIADQVCEVVDAGLGDEAPETRSMLVEELRTRFPAVEDDEPDPYEDEDDLSRAPRDDDEDVPPRPAANPPGASPPLAPRPGRAQADDEGNEPW